MLPYNPKWMDRYWLPCWLVSMLAITVVAAFKAPAPTCAIDVQPRIGTEPLTFVRVKVTVEDRLGGAVALLDGVGEWASSLVQPGARTTTVEWKDLDLGAGQYEVGLRTSGGCTARSSIEVR